MLWERKGQGIGAILADIWEEALLLCVQERAVEGETQTHHPPYWEGVAPALVCN